MKLKTLISIALMAFAITSNAQNFVPLPNSVTKGEGSFTINKHTTINYKEAENKFNAQYLLNTVSNMFNYDLKVTNEAVQKSNSIELKRVEGLGNEEYKLEVNNNNILISASTKQGIFYGIQTLLQMFPPEVYSDNKARLLELELPAIKVEDAPRFGHRGLMLDVSRTFFDAQTVKDYIDWLAYHKLNIFHWHLADDNGWRVEIKKYPDLTKKGAWRGKDEVLSPVFWSGDERYGGYYTQKEVKEIVLYAAERNINIIPEIDLPGHSRAATASYPSIACPTTSDIPSSCGEFDNVWCVGNEDNYKMLDNIIKELSALFPYKYMHIGGDEVVLDYWKKCPKCQALMKKEGMTEEIQLLNYFVRRLEKIVEKNGKVMMGWDEILDGGELHPTTTIVAWRSMKKGVESLEKGQPTVMQIAEYCYLDMKHTVAERGHDWAGIIPLNKIYAYNPQDEAIGVQVGLWSELMLYPARFDQHQIFPRLSALAEIGWTNQSNRNYDCFYKRLTSTHYERLYQMGIAFRVDPPKVTYNDKRFEVALPYPSAVVRYTTDGTAPNCNSPVYQGPFLTDNPDNFRFATFFNNQLKSIDVWASNIDIHRYQSPKTSITSNFEFKKGAKTEAITNYNYKSYLPTIKRAKAGDWIIYTFDTPVNCKKITVDTGYPGKSFYGVTKGYVEYSYDGVTFIKGEDFVRYSAIIAPEKPVKAVKIVATGENDGYMVVFQNLKIQ